MIHVKNNGWWEYIINFVEKCVGRFHLEKPSLTIQEFLEDFKRLIKWLKLSLQMLLFDTFCEHWTSCNPPKKKRMHQLPTCANWATGVSQRIGVILHHFHFYLIVATHTFCHITGTQLVAEKDPVAPGRCSLYTEITTWGDEGSWINLPNFRTCCLGKKKHPLNLINIYHIIYNIYHIYIYRYVYKIAIQAKKQKNTSSNLGLL